MYPPCEDRHDGVCRRIDFVTIRPAPKLCDSCQNGVGFAQIERTLARSVRLSEPCLYLGKRTNRKKGDCCGLAAHRCNHPQGPKHDVTRIKECAECDFYEPE